MPQINNIYIDDPKRLREPIKAIEVGLHIFFEGNPPEVGHLFRIKKFQMLLLKKCNSEQIFEFDLSFDFDLNIRF